MHNENLRRHFGMDKARALVEEFYYWRGIAKDEKKWVESCRISQHAKERRQNARLYTPLPILEVPWEELNKAMILSSYLLIDFQK
jgi:hypothetical protein